MQSTRTPREMYGLMPQLLNGDPEILATERGRRWYDALRSGRTDTIFATLAKGVWVRPWRASG
jgi:hypothetical protein